MEIESDHRDGLDSLDRLGADAISGTAAAYGSNGMTNHHQACPSPQSVSLVRAS
jgi:hypothetical protein